MWVGSTKPTNFMNFMISWKRIFRLILIGMKFSIDWLLATSSTLAVGGTELKRISTEFEQQTVVAKAVYMLCYGARDIAGKSYLEQAPLLAKPRE